MKANSKNFVFAVALAMGLSGCLTATPVMTPDGQQGFSINCSDFRSLDMCYQKAGEICGANGYKVINQQNESGGLFTSPNNTLLMRCKNASDN